MSFIEFVISFHMPVMSKGTNDAGLLIHPLFSFPVCWLAAFVWFAQRLSEALCNWYTENKSVGENVGTVENLTICSAFPDGS